MTTTKRRIRTGDFIRLSGKGYLRIVVINGNKHLEFVGLKVRVSRAATTGNLTRKPVAQ